MTYKFSYEDLASFIDPDKQKLVWTYRVIPGPKDMRERPEESIRLLTPYAAYGSKEFAIGVVERMCRRLNMKIRWVNACSVSRTGILDDNATGIQVYAMPLYQADQPSKGDDS